MSLLGNLQTTGHGKPIQGILPAVSVTVSARLLGMKMTLSLLVPKEICVQVQHADPLVCTDRGGYRQEIEGTLKLLNRWWQLQGFNEGVGGTWDMERVQQPRAHNTWRSWPACVLEWHRRRELTY